jgi:hypothetical protein
MNRRLLARVHVTRELVRLGCREIAEYETATMWETGSGVHFTVPHEGAERKTAADTFQEIVKDVENFNLFTGKRRL